MTATIIGVYANQKELNKIGKSYARSHEFKKAKITFKDPDKLKMEGTVGMVKIQYIICGETRIVRIPSLRYSKRENLSDEPGKAQTSLDVGAITDGLYDTHNVKHIGTEEDVLIFQLNRKGDDRWNQKIWVENKTFKLLKREKYRKNGLLKARYCYKDHHNVDSVIWIPFRTETYTPAGKLAGASELKNVKVNEGVLDSIFK